MQARSLVSQDPKRVAQVVKTWVGESMSEARSGRAGVDRAAILLLALGEQDAAQVLKHLGAKDVQRVGAAMAQLSGVSREEVSHRADAILPPRSSSRPRSASAPTTTSARC